VRNEEEPGIRDKKKMVGVGVWGGQGRAGVGGGQGRAGGRGWAGVGVGGKQKCHCPDVLI
jgi:hypothetical protein